MARPARRPCVPLWLVLLGLALGPAATGQERRPAKAGSAEEILDALEPDLAERLREERVVLLQEFGARRPHGGTIHALVLFERPPDVVFRLLIQSPRQTEFRPDLREARLAEELEAGHVVHYELRIMLMRIRYRIRHHWDVADRRIWWSLDSSFDNDLEALEGHWEIFPHGAERSLGRFGTRIDVGPALPAFLQDLATRSKLPESMHHVRRWVDSGGVYRP